MTQTRFTFLHAADLHIDSALRGLERYEEAPVAELRQATRRAFENLVRHAIAEEVAFVVLAGDVFDGAWPDFSTGLWFAKRLRELTDAGIRVYLLAGNHDAESKMSATIPYPEGVRNFSTTSPETIVDAATGVALHGQGFARAATTENIAAGYPPAVPGVLNIGVLHTALNGRDGHDPYAPCSPDDLRAKGYDYWALGHVHQREVVAEDPWIVFPGNLQARHIRETGAKGATLVTVENQQIRDVLHVPLDLVRYLTLEVDVSACTSRAACESEVGEAMDQARDEGDGRLLALRIRLSGRSPADSEVRREREAFIASCRERANARGDLWVEKVVIATDAPLSSSGQDFIDTLELDDEGLCAAVKADAAAGIEALLAKLPSSLVLAQEGLDLRSDPVIDALLVEARDELVRRLAEADAEAGKGARS